MEVSINERNHSHIQRKIESGQYSSADDVIASALALLDQRDEHVEREMADMRDKVQRGIEEADAGRLLSAKEVFDGLRQRNAGMSQERP